MSISKYMHIVIFLGGDAPPSNILNRDMDYVVVADAGFYVCKEWKIVPDLVIGDFDSVSVECVLDYSPKSEIIRLNQDKVMTDAEYSLIEVYRRFEMRNISIVGGMGQRIDHFMGILELFKRSYTPHRVIGHTHQIELISDNIQLPSHFIADKYISFFSLSENSIQKSRGLRWNLNDIVLSKNFASVSNEHTEDNVYISMIEGALLGIWAHNNKAAFIPQF